MSKDPAFLFYPGDYLRDTQCLSSDVQVAYDRIMCAHLSNKSYDNHMINIAISQAQLNFFTKRLTDDQKTELMMVLAIVDGGYCIDWVYASILKRKAYSESRSKNRTKHMNNICKTYVKHMENENEIVNEDVNAVRKPTPEEVRAYCKERNNRVDPQQWHDFYTAKNWMIGKNKMKNWKAAVRTWEKRDGFKPKEEVFVNSTPDPKQQEQVANLIRATVKEMGIK